MAGRMYRHCPMSRQEALACVVVWYHQQWQGPPSRCITPYCSAFRWRSPPSTATLGWRRLWAGAFWQSWCPCISMTSTSTGLGGSLLSASDVLEAIISMRPRRELMVLPMDVPRVVAASNAALEAPRQGSGGYHLVFQDGGVQIREAFVAVIPSQVYDMWGPGDHKIAQLELFMVVHALTADAECGSSITSPVLCVLSGAGVTTPTWPRWRRIFSVCSLRCEPHFILGIHSIQI